MKRQIAIVSALVICLGLVAFAADGKTDFSGTWSLDKAKSDPIRMGRGRSGDGGGQAPTIDITLVITQTDNQLNVTRKVTFNGQDRSTEQKFSLD
ncbi:MAG TPA: hypothetical protein VGL91_05845, partial [Acidobacteriota bacterium]